MAIQRTLTGGEAEERSTPETLIWCDECGEGILRSRRFDHEHDLSDDSNVTTAQVNKLKSKVPDHALFNTQTYEVAFHYESVEYVRVEAPCKSDAMERAREVRTLNGEYVDTIHTEKTALGSESQASIDYLEAYNLLPDNHGLTEQDIQEVLDAQ